MSQADYLEKHTCEAGRRADLGGHWTLPCLRVAIHVIIIGDASGLNDVLPIRLCDDHFQEALAAGLIDDPYPDQNDVKRRVAKAPPRVRRDLKDEL
jgi:hypothetical protein